MVYARKQKFLNQCKEIWNIDDNDFLISYREINPKIQKALFFSKNKFLVCTSNYYAKFGDPPIIHCREYTVERETVFDVEKEKIMYEKTIGDIYE